MCDGIASPYCLDGMSVSVWFKSLVSAQVNAFDRLVSTTSIKHGVKQCKGFDGMKLSLFLEEACMRVKIWRSLTHDALRSCYYFRAVCNSSAAPLHPQNKKLSLEASFA